MVSGEIIEQLRDMGQESYRKVIMKHGAKEPLFGVKIEELKKIAKSVKSGHAIALELYNSGIYDAMYLAGLMAEPAKMTKAQLEQWAATAQSQPLIEYTVPWVASESPFAMELAMEWIDTKDAFWLALAGLPWAISCPLQTIACWI